MTAGRSFRDGWAMGYWLTRAAKRGLEPQAIELIAGRSPAGLRVDGKAAFLNPFSYLKLRRRTRLLSEFDWLYVDGILLKMLLRLAGIQVERLSLDMTGLAPELLRHCADAGKSVVLIGGRLGVAARAAEVLSSAYPGLRVALALPGYFSDRHERDAALARVRRACPDVVLVGMGAGLQEEFISDLTTGGWQGAAYTCGGFLQQTAKSGLNYYPRQWDRLQLRWLYRILDEPRLVVRYGLYYPVAVFAILLDVVRYRRRLRPGGWGGAENRLPTGVRGPRSRSRPSGAIAGDSLTTTARTLRVLHAAALQHPTPGIVQQMLTEQAAADRGRLPWDARIFTYVTLPEEADSIATSDRPAGQATRYRLWVLHALSKLAYRRHFYRWLSKTAPSYDVVLLRHTYADPFRSRAIRKMAVPVVSVHHTLEGPELALAQGLSGRVRYWLEVHLGRRSIRASYAIAGVTREIAQYERCRIGAPKTPTLVMPNAVSVADSTLAADTRTLSLPELLFIATDFAPWHGLDRLLESVRSSAQEFRLHLVGRVAEPDLSIAASDSRVIVHGVLTQAEIADLSSSMWLGLSSFALDRKGMTEACSLKVRDYLASGLPVFTGHRDVFPPTAWFYRQGGPQIDAATQFAREVRHRSRLEVRTTAEPYIDKYVVLRAITKDLQSMLEQSPRHPNGYHAPEVEPSGVSGSGG